ncbi:MAG: hypothetical protein J5795_00225 [Lachnospiraceae bacterium]|nr:hypothetical protein [Lachnospiraceae bacterium]MBO7632348.1 hypothetical protein [Lachnospiraceae bacterium]
MDNTFYKCPACGTALRYSAASGKLECTSCGNFYEVADMEAAAQGGTDRSAFSWGNYKESLQQNTDASAKVYICKSCGAQILTDETTAATHCPYCDSEVVINDAFDGGLRPNGVIPFKITKERMKEIVNSFGKGKKLLPRDFFTNKRVSDVQGIYVPFWLFDGTVDGSVTFDAEKTRRYDEGDYRVEEISHYRLDREGQLGFRNVPVDGAVKMDDALMESIGPYDFSEITEFQTAYLSGFLADRFDQDPDASIGRAEELMMASTMDRFKSTANSYSNVRAASKNLRLLSPSVRYVLLPVYIINCKYGGKDYRYAINGQTGKMVGELPVSKQRKNAYFWGIFGAITVILGALMSFL